MYLSILDILGKNLTRHSMISRSWYLKLIDFKIKLLLKEISISVPDGETMETISNLSLIITLYEYIIINDKMMISIARWEYYIELISSNIMSIFHTWTSRQIRQLILNPITEVFTLIPRFAVDFKNFDFEDEIYQDVVLV